MTVAKDLANVLFIVAVPALLLAFSVAWAVNDAALYAQGFAKYGISQRTGISEADLVRVGADLRRYFNSGEEPLAIRAPVYGAERELFNQREVDHMRDVKGLVRGVYWVALAAGVYLGLSILAGLLWARQRSVYQLPRLLLAGSLVTVVLVAAVGLFALVGFDALFLVFHRISFANDLWQLDPRTDYLLIMFPTGFWFDATIRVASTAVAGAVALAALGAFLLYRQGRLNRAYLAHGQFEGEGR